MTTVRWTNLQILQPVLDRAIGVHQRCGEWEFGFDLCEDVTSEGILTRDDGSEEAFKYTIEGCDCCLGDDFVERPDGTDLCSCEDDWETYELIGESYTNEMIKGCVGG